MCDDDGLGGGVIVKKAAGSFSAQQEVIVDESHDNPSQATAPACVSVAGWRSRGTTHSARLPQARNPSVQKRCTSRVSLPSTSLRASGTRESGSQTGHSTAPTRPAGRECRLIGRMHLPSKCCQGIWGHRRKFERRHVRRAASRLPAKGRLCRQLPARPSAAGSAPA